MSQVHSKTHGGSAFRSRNPGQVPLWAEGSEVTELQRWFSEALDIRDDREIAAAIVKFVELHGAKTVVVADRILGCPHEEGVDYPEKQKCPKCPFWANRDRFTGKVMR